MRSAKIERKTKETEVKVELNLDGTGKSEVNTGIGFLDHMLTLFSKHSSIDLTVNSKGDLEICDHHTVEDIGICIGLALDKALGNKAGINRYGFFILPMDESQATVALDLSGRSYLVYDAVFEREKLGELSTEMIEHFFQTISQNAKMNLQIKVTGKNNHHKCEAIFKAFAKSLKIAVQIDENSKGEIPSTKGII